MLKLTYTEIGLHMERVMSAPEILIAQRVILAVRLSQPLYVQPGRASFLLPANRPELAVLDQVARQEGSPVLAIGSVDEAWVEVSLCGSWVAESHDAHEGMFLTVLGTQAEFYVYKLWQMSETHLSSLT